MRVIAGIRKGQSLLAPPGRDLRPTSDRVRTVLFDILGEFVVNARMLDLFAGAGTLGIEALSRGARTVDFVENQRAHAQCIEENLRRTHLEHHGRVILADAFAFLAQPLAAPYQLILADPPYACAQPEKLFGLIENVLAESGILVWESSIRNTAFRSGDVWEMTKERNLGETVLRFYQKRQRE